MKVSHFLIEIFCKNIIITKIAGLPSSLAERPDIMRGEAVRRFITSDRVKVCTNCVHVRV